MITTRFKDVVWTGGICVAALAFYMVSQSVAAKRAELAGVERKIASTNQEIRRLRTEIDTRAGLAQIEKWNQNVYGLQAPGAEQFAMNSVKLVALTQPAQATPLPLDPAIVASHGAVNKVSYDRIEDSTGEAPAARTAPSAPAIAQPALRQANYIQPKASALAPQAASPVHEAAVRKSVKLTRLDESFLDGVGDEGSARARKGRP